MTRHALSIFALCMALSPVLFHGCDKPTPEEEIIQGGGSGEGGSGEGGGTGGEEGGGGTGGEEGGGGSGSGTGGGGGQTNPDSLYYERVVSDLDDWTGDYLVTYTDKEHVYALGEWNTSYFASAADLMESLDDSLRIPWKVGKAYNVSIEKNNLYYNIIVDGVGYVGCGGKTAIKVSENKESGNDFQWSLLYNDGGYVLVGSVSSPKYRIMYNDSAPRFNTYAGTQKELTLYRLNGSGGGGSGEGGEGGEDDGGGGGQIVPPTPPDTTTCVNLKGFLSMYEVPQVTVKVPEGKSWSKTVAEKYGDTNAYVWDTEYDTRKVVTHTYSYNGLCRNYTFLMDKNCRAAVWVAYVMHKGRYPDKGVGRKGNWSNDPALPDDWQSPGNCGSGYSRGHQVASNSRQTTLVANQQAFYHTNQSPQWQTRFNDGVWNNLENAEQSHAPSGNDTLYVVTGPVYNSDKYLTDGAKNQVPCPSHFYKCFMLCSFNSSGEMTAAKSIGYLFTNKDQGSNKDYNNFSCTVDYVEEFAGFNFFANVPERLQNAAEAVQGLDITKIK